MSEENAVKPNDFIRQIIAAGGHDRVVTRFPPEPNGYLHIGHAKSICLNFGIAEENDGAKCRLRFDDTNPCKESQEYIDSIQADVRWLGFEWGERPCFTSDYFQALYDFAEALIQAGKAYVCHLNADQMREYRGSLTEPGRASPFRDRSPAESLDLFRRMKAGEFADGLCVLRGRIDMSSPNINMRDPVFYRIRRAVHHQTGAAWCIYPTYDYSHPLSDALEGVTHSLCTLEFEDHRPLYDWILDQFTWKVRPRQIEFSRLSLEHTVLSKRKLNTLVAEGHLHGWDDPRMPTLAGMRRRGYPPGSIREFCRRIGISRADNRVEMALLEDCVREELDRLSPRVMGVLRPLKVVIENFPEGKVEMLTAARHPKDPSMGERSLPFTREIFIDREDFRLEAPKEFKRLILGGEVRLRNGYVIQCKEALRDPDTGQVVGLRCLYDPKTLGADPVGRKVRGVIHWVSSSRSLEVKVRLYDRLFTRSNPDEDRDEGQDFTAHLNPESLVELNGCRVEEGLAGARAGTVFQFEREGYFCVDSRDAKPGSLLFNRTVTLRDTWGKMERKISEKG